LRGVDSVGSKFVFPLTNLFTVNTGQALPRNPLSNDVRLKTYIQIQLKIDMHNHTYIHCT